MAAGEVTMEDLYSILPFHNTLDKVTIKGKHLWRILQEKLGIGHKSILQVSGARIEYTMNPHTRAWKLTRLLVRCAAHGWCDIEDERVYTLAISNYLSNGGSGWSFPKYTISKIVGNHTIRSLVDYVKANSPMNFWNSGRLKFIHQIEPRKYEKVYDDSPTLFQQILGTTN